MEDIIYYSALYDYYGGLLTDVMQKYFEEYYFNNLSLVEIAENYCISKNAVSKTLKEVKEKLDYYESKLHLHNNHLKIVSILSDEEIKKIEEYI